MSQTNAVTESSRQAVRPHWQFQPGVSANPGGRKKDHELAAMLSPHVPTAVEAIVRNLSSDKHSLRAAEILLDRVFGKPAQSVAIEGDAATSNVLAHLLAARMVAQIQAQNGPETVLDGVAEPAGHHGAEEALTPRSASTPPPNIFEPASE